LEESRRRTIRLFIPLVWIVTAGNEPLSGSSDTIWISSDALFTEPTVMELKTVEAERASYGVNTYVRTLLVKNATGAAPRSFDNAG
jgi:hypothetical protein